MARQVTSLAINWRPRQAAAAGVVPEPQKKSATISPGLEDARMILSNNAAGF